MPPKNVPVPAENKVAAVVIPHGISLHDIYFEGRQRYYLLYIPENLDRTKPSPLLMALHGGGGTPEGMMEMSAFNSLADRYGFIVLYPSGTGSTPRRLFWNILLSETYASQNQINDIGFIQALLDTVQTHVGVDPKKVYASGFSQGGMMCYRIACDEHLSARIAAIAVVGATMTVFKDDCAAVRNVPVISFHGQKDPFSNYTGGIAENAPRNDRIARPGVEESIRYWTKRAGLSSKPTAAAMQGRAELRQYGPDTNGYEVVSWVLHDGGHTWPGSPKNLPEWMMGKENRDIDASVLIWDFFSRYSLP